MRKDSTDVVFVVVVIALMLLTAAGVYWFWWWAIGHYTDWSTLPRVTATVLLGNVTTSLMHTSVK